MPSLSMTNSSNPDAALSTCRRPTRAALIDVSHFNFMETLTASTSFPANVHRAIGCSKPKIAKKTTYKHIPHSEKPPHLVAKRNERERKRVQAVNSAFLQLRKHVPHEPKHKRLSKFKTLKVAIQYIHHLQDLIQSYDDKMADDHGHHCTTRGHLDLSRHQPPQYIPPTRTCHHRPYKACIPPCSQPYYTNNNNSHSNNKNNNPLNTDDIDFESHNLVHKYAADEYNNCNYVINTPRVNNDDSNVTLQEQSNTLHSVCNSHDSNSMPHNGGYNIQLPTNDFKIFDSVQTQSSLEVPQLPVNVHHAGLNIPTTAMSLPLHQTSIQSSPMGSGMYQNFDAQNQPSSVPSHTLNLWHTRAIESAQTVYDTRCDGSLSFSDTCSDNSATSDSLRSSLNSWTNNSNKSGVTRTVSGSNISLEVPRFR